MYHYICIFSFTAVMLLLCVRILLSMENAKQVWLQKQQYGAAKNKPSSGTLSRNRRHYFGYHGLRAVLPPGPDDLILCKMLYSVNFVYLFTLICTSPYHMSLEENTCIWLDFDLICPLSKSITDQPTNRRINGQTLLQSHGSRLKTKFE